MEVASGKPKRSIRLNLDFGQNRRAVVLGLLFIVITFGAVRFGGLANMVPFLHSSSNLKPEPLMKPKTPEIRHPSPASAPPAVKTCRRPPRPIPYPSNARRLNTQSYRRRHRNAQDGRAERDLQHAAPDIEPRIEFETTGSVPDTKTKAAPVADAAPPTELPPEIGTTGLRMAALPPIQRRLDHGALVRRPGVPADMAEAKRWFEIAFGRLCRRLSLGNMHERLRTPICRSAALLHACCRSRKYQGHAQPAVLAEGADGKPDYACARWFRIASDHNVRDSRTILACSTRGAGVERNFANPTLVRARGRTGRR